MLLVTILVIPKQESVSLVTTKTIAPLATLELDLALVEILIIATHVVTRLHIIQIMAISILRQWDTFWCSERKLIWANLLLALNESYLKRPVVYYLREKRAVAAGGGRPFYWMFILKHFIFRGLFSDEKAFNTWGSF